jgi:hypothetical protein
VLADGEQERLHGADVAGAGPVGARAACGLGGVAFQHRPGQLGQRADLHGRGGQERGEDRQVADVAGGPAGAGPGAKLPAHPPFGQLTQPPLADPVEPQPPGRADWDAQPAQVPDTAGMLGLPPLPAGELVHALPRQPQEPTGSGVACPHGAGERVEHGVPGRLGPRQQRAGTAGSDHANDQLGVPGPQLAAPLVGAALQRVLHLGLELGWQGAQVDLADGVGLAVAEELLQVGAAGPPLPHPPPVQMRPAQRLVGGIGPQPAP